MVDNQEASNATRGLSLFDAAAHAVHSCMPPGRAAEVIARRMAGIIRVYRGAGIDIDLIVRAQDMVLGELYGEKKWFGPEDAARTVAIARELADALAEKPGLALVGEAGPNVVTPGAMAKMAAELERIRKELARAAAKYERR